MDKTTREWRFGATVDSTLGAPCTLHTSSSPTLLAVVLSAGSRSRLPDRRDGPGEKNAPHQFVPAVKVCHGRPQVTSSRLRKGVPGGPRLPGRRRAREALGRSDREEAGVGGREARTERKTIAGRTRTAWGRRGARLPEALQRKGERVALRSARTRRSLAPPERARASGAASFLRTRPALLI